VTTFPHRTHEIRGDAMTTTRQRPARAGTRSSSAAAAARTARTGGGALPQPADHNLAIVQGTLSSDPRERVLPSGDRLLSLEITCRLDGETTTVPIAWFDPSAAALRWAAGDRVVVTGRIRRRFFRSGSSTASRTEVVATDGARLGTARAREVVARAVRLLTG
jgi:single-strand DNA-binding protein